MSRWRMPGLSSLVHMYLSAFSDSVVVKRITASRPITSAILRVSVAGVLAAGGTFSTGCTQQAKGPDLGTKYLFTVEQAHQLDYRIAWESAATVAEGGETNSIHAYDDFIVATETGANIVSAVTVRDGQPTWNQPVGDQLEHLVGITRIDDHIIASTQSDCYTFDIANGNLVQHTKYDPNNAAATSPVPFGQNLIIYGTPDGRIVYHNLPIGLMQSAYRFDSGISLPPLMISSTEMCVLTQTGAVILMDPSRNSRLWENRVLDPVKAMPCADQHAVYVAGTDQSLWAFRLNDGKFQWRYRCQQPLTDNPKVIAGVVYEAVPRKGLVAIDALTGQEKWVSASVAGGTVITRHKEDLIVWDQQEGTHSNTSTFYRVNERTGAVEGSATIAGVHWAVADKMESGNIYGLGRSGRLIKLIP